MKILFIGGVVFSELVLTELIRMGARIVGVCTRLECAPGTDQRDLSALSAAAGIPVRRTSDINAAEDLDWIRSLEPDVVYCFGWSALLRKPLLELAPFGVVGFHPTALPQNRGRHPLIWALALGLETTASTFFFMDEGADSGDILSQRALAIRPQDDAGSLYRRVTELAIEQVREFTPALANGTASRRPQDHRQASYWRKRTRTDGQIDWRMSARSIHNLVRALTHPYVGAHFVYANREVKVWRSEAVRYSHPHDEPGKVLALDSRGPVVKAGSDSVRLCEVDPELALSIGDYL